MEGLKYGDPRVWGEKKEKEKERAKDLKMNKTSSIVDIELGFRNFRSAKIIFNLLLKRFYYYKECQLFPQKEGQNEVKGGEEGREEKRREGRKE